MSKFVVIKTIKLDFLEPKEQWSECYLQIASLSLGEVEKMSLFNKENMDKATEYMISLLQEKLIGGKGWDGKEVVDIKKEDVKELPVEAINYIFQELISGLSKKK